MYICAGAWKFSLKFTYAKSCIGHMWRLLCTSSLTCVYTYILVYSLFLYFEFCTIFDEWVLGIPKKFHVDPL